MLLKIFAGFIFKLSMAKITMDININTKSENFSKIKPVLDYSVMALILYKIIN